MAIFKDYYYRPISGLKAVEGGYVFDPKDKGKETYMGVSRRYNPDFAGWAIIDKEKQNKPLKRGSYIKNDALYKMVYDFLYQKYWVKGSFGLIDNQSIAEILADWRINGGMVGNLVAEIQRLIGANDDGFWGKNSSLAVNKFANNEENTKLLFDKIKENRLRAYKSDSSYEHHKKGWLNRLNGFIFTQSIEDKKKTINRNINKINVKQCIISSLLTIGAIIAINKLNN
jgi:lysozyme family protein